MSKLLETQELAIAGVVDAPASFKSASLHELERVCNGCGAANAKFDFVPDKIWGTYVGHACNIHDWDYEFGVDNEDKEIADRRMRNNLLRLIRRDCKKKWYKPKAAMELRAQFYYKMVCWRGGPSFWSGKN
jgi:hypothetical protein